MRKFTHSADAFVQLFYRHTLKTSANLAFAHRLSGTFFSTVSYICILSFFSVLSIYKITGIKKWVKYFFHDYKMDFYHESGPIYDRAEYFLLKKRLPEKSDVSLQSEERYRITIPLFDLRS